MTLKQVGFPCSGLNEGSSFIAQGKAMYESLVENLEKDQGDPSSGQGPHIR